jgi:hypothetical protein
LSDPGERARNACGDRPARLIGCRFPPQELQ